ncbi:hypothetical protein [Lentzea flaviverrucosa]|uniref:Uncharacterized protein n=1 Tax=Lentzea flaviverrucosa TaxID=200379 RepID=A0A1H9VLG8_9PSEU|nr:hypothetical protein [Lentzea flaviverrucosa]RDI23780.1 hypothetical protein DFR72_110186 [Lentzea flaviverrucosa]SES22404.1 hypothetical protein SAMN05216195_110150 [Lentzea flaviverrucosa]
MRRMLAVLALVASSFVVTSAASAASCANVKVVVDFTSFGGGVQTACTTVDPSSGIVALQNVKFVVGYVPRQPGFVCTINALPNPCNGAPTTAYWSYWHGTPGGTWTYSSSGAGSYNPAPGTVEGWSFGAGTAPSTTP